jgi:hypothetical protein
VALAFIPVLAIVVLGFDVALTLTNQTRPGDEHLVVPVLFLLGLVFLGVQLLHLHLVKKALSRNGS